MLLVNGDLINLSVVGTLYGQRVMTSYGFRVMSVSGAIDSREAQDKLNDAVATNTGTNLLSTYQDITTDDLEINQIWSQIVRPIRMRKSVKNVALQGFISALNGTPNIAAVITRKSDLASRSSISNLHIPAAPTDLTNMSEGVFTPAYRTKLDAHAFESYDTINVSWFGNSFNVKGVIINKASADPNWQEITAHSINHNMRVMRRRTVGLGE